MLMQRLAVGFALGLVALGGAACGDDDDNKEPVGADGSVVQDEDAALPEGPDGLPSTDMDGGGKLGLDAGLGGGSADGSTAGDGAVGADGAVVGDGSIGAGATLDGGARADGGCDIVDERFGCGTVDGDWVRFDSGYELDRTRKQLWSPPRATRSDDELYQECQALVHGGIDGFNLPTMNQIRTLAAGCATTQLGGSCPLETDVCIKSSCGLDETACKACEPGKGPHASGGFCRPELGECTAMWSLDYCDDLSHGGDCTTHRHWYYDVKTGGFALADEGAVLAGRCVATLP